MRDNNRDVIYQIVSESGLSVDEKNNLFLLFRYAGNEELKPVRDLLESDPKTLKFLYENLAKKIDALRNDDIGALEELIKEEKETILQIGGKQS